MGQNHVAEKFHSIEIKSSMMVRRFCSPLLFIWSQASLPLLSHVSFNITVKTHGREEAHFLIPLAQSLFGGTKVKLCQFLNAKDSHGLIHCCYHFIPRQRFKKGQEGPVWNPSLLLLCPPSHPGAEYIWNVRMCKYPGGGGEVRGSDPRPSSFCAAVNWAAAADVTVD